MRSSAIICVASTLALSAPALADSCLPSLQATPGASSSQVVMTTMNSKQIVGYGAIVVSLVPSQIAGKPASWEGQKKFGGGEIFSNNRVPGNPSQIFAVNQTKRFNIGITQETSPTVTVVPMILGQKIEFIATCSANGVMHGVAAGNDYLLTLAPIVVIQ